MYIIPNRNKKVKKYIHTVAQLNNKLEKRNKQQRTFFSSKGI